MKTKITILLFLITTQLISAQEQIVERFTYGYDLVSDGSKYGLKKKSKYIIPVFFDSIVEVMNNDGSASKNFFLVYQNGHQGVFNKEGKMLIPVTFHHVSIVDANMELFEVTDTGLRAFYISKPLDRIPDFYKVDHTLLASRFETTLLDWLSIMQYAIESDGEDAYKKLIPNLSKSDPKTKILLESFLKQVDSEFLISQKNYYYWGTQKYTVNLLFDNSVDQFKNLNSHTLLMYPVTGITYDQVKYFFELKNKMYNEELNPYTDYKIAIRFRLPKIHEWEGFALNGLNESMKTSQAMDSINIKNCPLFHFRYTFTCESVEKMKKERGEGIVASNDFWPSNLGLFNVFGNVAEMIDEKGYCKGGSLVHLAIEASIAKTITYAQAEPWLGFRQVADIIYSTK